MPMTPFIGVRISWLMFARNSVFSACGFGGLVLAGALASSPRCAD